MQYYYEPPKRHGPSGIRGPQFKIRRPRLLHVTIVVKKFLKSF